MLSEPRILEMWQLLSGHVTAHPNTRTIILSIWIQSFRCGIGMWLKYNCCYSPQYDLPSWPAEPGPASAVCPEPVQDGVCSILANIWAIYQGFPSWTPRRREHWNGICSCIGDCMRICIWLIRQSAKYVGNCLLMVEWVITRGRHYPPICASW